MFLPQDLSFAPGTDVAGVTAALIAEGGGTVTALNPEQQLTLMCSPIEKSLDTLYELKLEACDQVAGQFTFPTFALSTIAGDYNLWAVCSDTRYDSLSSVVLKVLLVERMKGASENRMGVWGDSD